MKLSWSHKLFLKINNQIGKRPWLDKLMIFNARWLIFLFFFLVAVHIVIYFNYKQEAMVVSLFFYMFVRLLIPVFAFNWFIALIRKHQRPKMELPNITELVVPFQRFKTFPSDHATISIIMAITYSFFIDSIILTAVAYFLALLISVARVYVGVHYPRDILAGLAVGSVATYINLFIIG